jgi:hypothetical protein
MTEGMILAAACRRPRRDDCGHHDGDGPLAGPVGTVSAQGNSSTCPASIKSFKAAPNVEARIDTVGTHTAQYSIISFATENPEGGLVGPEFGDDVLFGTGPGLFHDYRRSAPGTRTLDDTGGAISNAPLKTVDPADINVLRLDAGTMSLTWHC